LQIASAADDTTLPSEPTASFASADYLNKYGEFTWPIVVMMYVCDNPVEQGLLEA